MAQINKKLKSIILSLNSMTKKDWINLILPIAAFIISIISLSYTICNDIKIKDVSFANTGLQNRPLLEFEENLEKIHYTLNFLIPTSTELSVDEKLAKTKLTLEASPELTVTNSGNSVAMLLLQAVTDKYSGLPEIRNSLINKKDLDSFSIKLTEDFYKTKGILPGGKHIFQLPHSITDINYDLGEFTVHYLLVYQNEAGNIFDSYCWVRFKIEPIQFKWLTNGENVQPIPDKESVNRKIKIIDTHFSTTMYSRQESRKINKFHKHYQKTFLRKAVSSD